MKAQTAVEYLILLGLLSIIALVGFTTFLPQTYHLANAFYRNAASSVYGDPPAVSATRLNYP